MSMQKNNTISNVRDNCTYGKVADFLGDKIMADSKLSIVSAYFTIYAYEALSKQLDGINNLRFLFGEPRFVTMLDPDKSDKKAFKIEDDGLQLANRLQQKEVAQRCAAWIREKVEIRSIRQSNFLHGKLYHIDDGKREHVIMGSSNFTRRGLGLSSTPNIELNLIINNEDDRKELREWFDSIWIKEELVEDVKEDVLCYLQQLYVDHDPEFIYFKTLFHIFERFLIA
ncbi:MAG: ATP-dependent helicase, partial [Lentisphaerae bacterium]|nr:ATP-dependent helicase [Lentisphaerota bacterium]